MTRLKRARMRLGRAACILCVCVLFALPAGAAGVSYPAHTSDFFVNDYAGVLSDATRNEIVSIGRALDERTTAQVVVVTLKTLGDSDIDDYAVGLLRTWGVGQKGKNNGVLILVSVDDHKDRIEVGYGLEGEINDAKAGRVLRDVMAPQLRQSDYNGAILNSYKTIVGYVCQQYGVSSLSGVNVQQAASEGNGSGLSTIIIGVLLFLVFAWMSFRGPFGRGPLGRRGPFNRGRFGGFYGGFGGGFGGFGGGSSGGGGGFSGGGGSSGGGGASGGW